MHFRRAKDIHRHPWTLSVWRAVFLREKDPGLWSLPGFLLHWHWINLIQLLKHSYLSLRKSPQRWPHLYISSAQNFFFCSHFWTIIFLPQCDISEVTAGHLFVLPGKKCFRLTTFVFVWLQPSCTCFVKYSFFIKFFQHLLTVAGYLTSLNLVIKLIICHPSTWWWKVIVSCPLILKNKEI